jgi:MarR family transcriptional regulator, organic hydroperoxide resistance regulator
MAATSAHNSGTSRPHRWGAAGPGPDTGAESGSVVAALHQATHATLHLLGARLEHLGLTASEQNVLAALADDRVLSVGELAAATGTKPSTLTSVLDRLERRECVERDIDRSDRRSVLIRLTAAGQEPAAAVRAAIADLEQAALAGLTRQELAGFLAVTIALTKPAR